MNVAFDIVSRIGMFLIVFSILYFLFNTIFSVLFKFDKIIVLNRFLLSDLLSIASSVFFIFNFITISSPYA